MGGRPAVRSPAVHDAASPPITLAKKGKSRKRGVSRQGEPPPAREADLIGPASRDAMQEGAMATEWLEGMMREALREASRAEAFGEVPVGAVVELDGRIIGRGCNRSIGDLDPTAHAEIAALREAARTVANYRLPGARLFVTVEPCPMCAGACLHARIDALIFGAPDLKAGAVCSRYRLLDDPHHNHRVRVIGGVLEDECAEKIRAFFRHRREGGRGP